MNKDKIKKFVRIVEEEVKKGEDKNLSLDDVAVEILNRLFLYLTKDEIRELVNIFIDKYKPN